MTALLAQSQTLTKNQNILADELHQQSAKIDKVGNLSKIAVGAAADRAKGLLESLILPVIVLTGGIVLWRSVLPDPSAYQLIGLGLYGICLVGPVFFWRK